MTNGVTMNLTDTRLLVSVSGGKDSDAMAILLNQTYHEQITLIHADTGRMEWPQTIPHIESLAARLKLPLVIVRHPDRDLLDGIRRRMAMRPDAPPFPSARARWCTSDYKRAVIDTWIRANVPHGGRLVSAIGLRREESFTRSKKSMNELRASVSTYGRQIHNWYPILEFALANVWKTIGLTLDELREKQAICREKMAEGTPLPEIAKSLNFPAHMAYLAGNTRLSCAMCVLGNKNDLSNGARLNPQLYRELVAIERESGFTFQQNKPLSALHPELLET